MAVLAVNVAICLVLACLFPAVQESHDVCILYDVSTLTSCLKKKKEKKKLIMLLFWFTSTSFCFILPF